MTDTQETTVATYRPTQKRRHMAELIVELPGDLWREFQVAAEAIPAVQEGVELNQSFKTVQALIEGGHGNLGNALAALVQADLRSHLTSA